MEPMGNMTTTHVAAVLDVRTSTLSPHSLSLSLLSLQFLVYIHTQRQGLRRSGAILMFDRLP